MKEKMYLSTRGDQKPLNFYEAILQGIGSDGTVYSGVQTGEIVEKL